MRGEERERGRRKVREGEGVGGCEGYREMVGVRGGG